jgi:hypothetical protein
MMDEISKKEKKKKKKEKKERERAKQYYIRHGIAMLCVCTRVTWSFPPNKSTNSPVNPWAWSKSFFLFFFFVQYFRLPFYLFLNLWV